MEFPKTTEMEDRICYEEGFRILGELRKKYSNNNMRDLDIVLNSLCCALIRLFKLNSRPEDAEACAELVQKIILKNLKNDKN